MSVTVANTTSNLSGATIVLAGGTHTITGAWTFDRDPSAPFAVTSGSAVVTNLDADKVDGYEASELAILAENETVSGNWTHSGTTTFTGVPTFTAKPVVNAGLAFPASQASDAGANVLDDYEEGSWTPTIGGSGGQSGQVYSIQVGRYVKIGSLVHLQGRIALSTLGTVTTVAQIQGLPFASANTTNNYSALAVGFFTGLTTSVVLLGGNLPHNASAIDLILNTAAAASVTSVAQADLSNTFGIVFSIDYIAAT